MCDVQHGFRFCTCLPGEKPGAGGAVGGESGPAYIWRLARYAGEVENGPVGSIVGPSHELGSGITAEVILEKLNAGNCFDFAYEPAERDSLHISWRDQRNDYRYMSFLFEGGKWDEGMNSPFGARLEDISGGKIKIERED